MNPRLSLASLHNPYDFANPVSREALFSGRRQELDQISYYLDEATKAPRPMNLAILGARASGKTSLLNMIDIKAREKGLCVARVDLNEGDVETQLGFFQKLFDSTLSAVCDFDPPDTPGARPFGGRKGKTYDVYLDMVSAYRVPDEKDWCPFLFPIQYAKAMSAGFPNVRLSDQSLRHDLGVLRAEVGVPIAILIDECNVLAQQRILLEVLRNLFMNTPGYMLVFTGTPDLFPVMDEVFSPIVRQFKKIVVGAFEKPTEVEECVRKPLESVGLTLRDTMAHETFVDLTRRRAVAGGRPYEIQLLCHFMFRRLQQGRASRMELDLDVLEDVLVELQQTHDFALRPVARAVRSLTNQQLHALQTLGWSSGLLRFDELWFVEYVPNGTTRWTRDELAAHLSTFVDLGILRVSDERIVFAGDELERLYSKYYARREDVTLELSRLPPEVGCELALSASLEELGLSIAGPLFELTGSPSTNDAPLGALVTHLGHPDSLSDADVRDPRTAAVYEILLDLRDEQESSAELAELSVRTLWMNARFLLAMTEESAPRRAAAQTALQDMATRAAELGGEFVSTWESIAALPVEPLRDRLAAHPSARARMRFAEEHISRMFEAYTEKADRDTAAFHASSALAFGRDVRPSQRNNAAYVLLQRDPEAAQEALLSTVADIKEEAERALPYYNLGVIAAQRGDLVLALSYFEKAASLGALRTEPESNACLFLFVPRIEEGRILFEEARDADLRVSAESAAVAVSSVLQLKGS